MRLTAAVAAALACSAAPLSAAELADRYEEMGRMEVTLDGETRELVIPYDTESDRYYARQRMILDSFLTVTTVGRALAENGMPVRPMLQVTLQRRNGEMTLLSAEMFDGEGFDTPLAMGPDGGSGEVTEYSFDDDVLVARVEGEFLRLRDYMGDPAVAEGASPVPVTITWETEVAPAE